MNGLAVKLKQLGIALLAIAWMGLNLFSPPPARAKEIHSFRTPPVTQLADVRLGADSIQPPTIAAPNLLMPSLTEGVRKTVSSNGLTVLSKEVHTAPVVAVQVWYRVGSANETSGNNGISHQLEHLLFKGTRERPVQFGRLFDAIGSRSNAFTTFDATAYVNTLSRDRLDTILTLEADRALNTRIDDASVESEKRVVISELQGYENSPNYRLNRAVRSSLFESPRDSSIAAYGLPIGGTRADVAQFTPAQIKAYYRQYYAPDNAVLVVVGDFDTNDLLHSVRNTFGKLRGHPNRTKAQPAIAKPLPPSDPIHLEEPGSLRLLSHMYPLPAATHPDVPALDLLSAILSRGRSGRFYRNLIQTNITNSVSSGTSNLQGAGWFNVGASMRDGQPTEAVEEAIFAELERLRAEPASEAELQRVKRQLIAGVVLGFRDISSQARQLGSDEVLAGDYRDSDRYLQAAAAVTPADIQRVARQYLRPELCHKGYFTPTQFAPSDLSTDAGEAIADRPATVVLDDADNALDLQQYLPAAADSEIDFSNQPIPEKIVYGNGLKLLLLPDRSAPVVTLEGQVDAGSGFDRPETAGLAALTASNLTSGTERQTALEFAETLENLGAGLGFAARREGVEFGGAALAQDLPLLVEQLADALLRPTFPADQLELNRQRSLARLQAILDNPSSVAVRTFQQSLYPPDHPYYTMTTAESLQAIGRDEAIAFYQAHYRPDTTTIALVGDFDVEAAKALFSQYFNDWSKPGTAPKLEFPEVTPLAQTERQYARLEGKSQSVTYLGHLGIKRLDPNFETALLLNDIVGGNTLASRLGREIRDRQGLTYGISSGFRTGRGVGPFVVSMQTDPTDVDRAVESAIAVLDQVKSEGVTEAELELSRDSIVNSFPVSLADPDAVASAFLQREVLGIPLEDLYEFPQKLKAIELEDVNRLAQQILQPEAMQIVTAGP
ncbi:pitrilysin family protein [Synechococcus sp. PCC 7336]|uniref:M16 family metallopeptidase n=1 Tax=Synechococcus sp. PCC 7336 TaxID=195250 RepID=UPI000347819E|nr:pitrilysin family protein [Synechococcus sp. PCC 7336]